MSTAFHIAKNTFYQIVGKTVGTILGLLTVALMTRYLGQFGYGNYVTIIAYLQFFNVLIDFGLQMTATHLLARPGADEQKIFSNIFTLRLVSSILFLSLSIAISFFLPYDQVIKAGIAVASLSFLFVSLQSVTISIFQKNMRMADVAMAEMAGRAVLLAGVALSVTLQWSLLAMVWATVLGNLLNFVWLAVGSRKFLRFKLSWNQQQMKEIISVSWPLAVSIALTLVYFRADTVILSLFRSQNEVGIYGATYKVLEILVQFPYLFLGLLLPLLSKFFDSNKMIFDKIIQKAFDFMMILILPMVLGALVAGNKLLVFVAGDQFYLSGDILKILIWAAAGIYLSALFGYAIMAAGRQKKMIKFYLINAVLGLLAYFVFIPVYGYWSAAIITVATELFMAVSSWWIIRYDLNVRLSWSVPLRALAAAALMAVCLWPLADLNLFTILSAGIIIYFTALVLFKGVTKETVSQFKVIR